MAIKLSDPSKNQRLISFDELKSYSLYYYNIPIVYLQGSLKKLDSTFQLELCQGEVKKKKGCA